MLDWRCKGAAPLVQGCCPFGAGVLPLWCRGAALSGTDVFSMSIQCFKFLINPNSPYDNIYY